MSVSFVVNLLMKNGYRAIFVISGLLINTAQTQKKTLCFINVIFAKLNLTFNCCAI
jgi:hypothetical protein